MTHNSARIACLQMAVTLAVQKLIAPKAVIDTALAFCFVAEADATTVERLGLPKLVRDHLDSMYDHSERADLIGQLRTMLDTFECP
jgi:hypothetical protein